MYSQTVCCQNTPPLPSHRMSFIPPTCLSLLLFILRGFSCAAEGFALGNPLCLLQPEIVGTSKKEKKERKTGAKLHFFFFIQYSWHRREWLASSPRFGNGSPLHIRGRKMGFGIKRLKVCQIKSMLTRREKAKRSAILLLRRCIS